MLARLMADGGLAPPQALPASFPGGECLCTTGGRSIVSSPMRLIRADEGIAEADVRDATA